MKKPDQVTTQLTRCARTFDKRINPEDDMLPREWNVLMIAWPADKEPKPDQIQYAMTVPWEEAKPVNKAFAHRLRQVISERIALAEYA